MVSVEKDDVRCGLGHGRSGHGQRGRLVDRSPVHRHDAPFAGGLHDEDRGDVQLEGRVVGRDVQEGDLIAPGPL